MLPLMPTHRATTLDAVHLDSALTLDVDAGVAEIDLSRVNFVDACALTGLACFIASAARDGLSVELVLPEHPDLRSWLSRMHLGAVIDTFDVHVGGGLPRVAERDRRDARNGSSWRSGTRASASGNRSGSGMAR